MKHHTWQRIHWHDRPGNPYGPWLRECPEADGILQEALEKAERCNGEVGEIETVTFHILEPRDEILYCGRRGVVKATSSVSQMASVQFSDRQGTELIQGSFSSLDGRFKLIEKEQAHV